MLPHECASLACCCVLPAAANLKVDNRTSMILSEHQCRPACGSYPDVLRKLLRLHCALDDQPHMCFEIVDWLACSGASSSLSGWIGLKKLNATLHTNHTTSSRSTRESNLAEPRILPKACSMLDVRFLEDRNMSHKEPRRGGVRTTFPALHSQ